MRKIFKIGIITSLALFTLGLGFLIAAVALGATWAQFTDNVTAGPLWMPWTIGSIGTRNTDHTDRISFPDADKLEIRLGAGTLDIRETDDDQITVETISDPSGIVQTDLVGKTLKINTGSTSTKQKVEICLYLPEDLYFYSADLELGAAAVTVDYLEADELNVKLGAGTLDCSGEITADQSDWTVGVGSLYLEYLDCENVSLDCGMGSMAVTMADEQDDYACDVSCGAGAVNIGDNTFSLGSHSSKGDDPDGKLDVRCGMGSVDIVFYDE